MTVIYEKLAVIGIGLIGSSVALAARRAGAVGHGVRGCWRCARACAIEAQVSPIEAQVSSEAADTLY